MFSRPFDRALGVGVAIAAVVGLCVVAGAVMLAIGGQSPEDRAAALAELAVPTTAAAAPSTPTAPAAPVTDHYRPDDRWLATTSTATGIPVRALSAYARAHLQISAEQPECEVAWNTIAALGAVESAHGTMAGDSVLGTDGRSTPQVFGPRLDGSQFAAIRDTDGGTLDGDAEWDRAVGPMQFIPSTWADWSADADGDGIADPHQIDDAALAAGRYLCHSGSLDSPEAWRRAIFSYNHSDEYVTDIATIASDYAARVS